MLVGLLLFLFWLCCPHSHAGHVVIISVLVVFCPLCSDHAVVVFCVSYVVVISVLVVLVLSLCWCCCCHPCAGCVVVIMCLWYCCHFCAGGFVAVSVLVVLLLYLYQLCHILPLLIMLL